MARFTAKQQVHHDGKLYKPGEPIELDEASEERLGKMAHLELAPYVAPAKPADKEAKKK